jgi:cytochrome c oxidase cbb3-type subunit 3
MQDFIHFNCIGCHANTGAGGIGPALSNESWIYGSSPENIFLTIYQGRPNGMPAWGNILPTSTIWELVSYIEKIWKRPGGKFGITTSLNPPSPAIQQVPAEILQTTDPWAHVEPFSDGQKPASQGGTASIK